MNQGRIWTVVNPTVGLPLLIGAVALTSVGVHVAILSSTTWMSSYWQGAAKTKVSLQETATPQVAALAAGADSAYTVSVTPAPNGGASFVVTVTPKTASADVAADKSPGKLALASPPPQ